MLGRLPHRRPVEPRRGAPLPGRRQRPGQLGLAVRPRPLRLRGATSPSTASTAPLVQRRRRARAATSWNAALDRPRRADRARRSTPAAPQRIAVLGGARGTNEDAFAWAQLADALGIADRDAQLGDGLPAEVLGLPRATIDEAAAAPTIILLGPDLEGGAAASCTCACATPSRRAHTEIVEFTPKATGLSRSTPGAVGALRARRRRRRGRDRARRCRHRRAAREPDRSSSSPAARTSPSRAAATVARAATTLPSPRCRDAKVLPALRRGNVVGALQLGLAPAPTARSRRASLAAAAADGKIECSCCSAPTRSTTVPDADLARRALAGARVDHRRRHVPHRVVAAGRRRARRRGVRREGRHHHQHRGSGHARSPSRSRRTAPARPDWMIAAELADASARSTLGDRRCASIDVTDAIAAHGRRRTQRSTRAALDGDRDGVARRARPGWIDARRRARPSPTRNSYDYRLVVSRKLYDQAVGTAHVAVARAARRRSRRAARPPARPRRHRRRRRAPTSSSSARRGSIVLPLVADDGGPARHRAGCRSTSRGAPTSRELDRRRPPRSPTSGSSGVS